MNLDTVARLATDDLLSERVDVDASLARLRRTRRSRAGARLGAVALAAAVVVSLVGLGPHRDRSPQPASPDGVSPGALVGIVDGRLWQLSGAPLPHLPTSVDTVSPLAFTPDGRGLLYASGGRLMRTDLTTGRRTTLYRCPGVCPTAVSADGLRSVTANRTVLIVTRLSDGTHQRVRLPVDLIENPSWSPDGSRIAFYGTAHGRGGVYVVRPDGSHLTRVYDAGRSTVWTAPQWRPDGGALAFILETPAASGPPAATLTRLDLSSGRANAVHGIGHCYCLNFVPAVTWAPDGSRIAVALTGRPDITSLGGPVYTVRPDGSEWRRASAAHVDEALAWQPLPTTSAGP